MGHIAQMNMGYLLFPHGDPRVAGFEGNSDLVNAVADRSKGFIWRLQGAGYDLPENDAGALFGRPEVALATLSTWESFEDFENFVHNTIHGKFIDRRAQWFEHVDDQSYVIWPIEAGHVPSLTEGKSKLLELRSKGPSSAAFDFATGRRMSG
ncbi:MULTISPECIES: DUF3291 domain-containing protein [unclassified Ruegeria]|uniref:DUF3291 domain-containing protein n=1 Tax=unclassified Ruegeria TaxID=2625375 RepID=UPI0014889BD4|nr:MULTISPECIES: DUF3291 domain-containing protein [unclassified Ruegeria]